MRNLIGLLCLFGIVLCVAILNEQLFKPDEAKITVNPKGRITTAPDSTVTSNGIRKSVERGTDNGASISGTGIIRSGDLDMGYIARADHLNLEIDQLEIKADIYIKKLTDHLLWQQGKISTQRYKSRERSYIKSLDSISIIIGYLEKNPDLIKAK